MYLFLFLSPEHLIHSPRHYIISLVSVFCIIYVRMVALCGGLTAECSKNSRNGIELE